MNRKTGYGYTLMNQARLRPQPRMLNAKKKKEFFVISAFFAAKFLVNQRR
jgi:hypothetical protein